MARKGQRVYPVFESNPKANTNPEDAECLDDDRMIERIMRFALASGQEEDGDDQGGDKKMPQFGDLQFCEVEVGVRNALWRLDARRLINAAGGPVDPLRFPSHHAPTTPDREGFLDLAKVADQAFCALQICSLDDQMVLHKCKSPAFDPLRWSQSESAFSKRVEDSHQLPGDMESVAHPLYKRSGGSRGGRVAGYMVDGQIFMTKPPSGDRWQTTTQTGLNSPSGEGSVMTVLQTEVSIDGRDIEDVSVTSAVATAMPTEHSAPTASSASSQPSGVKEPGENEARREPGGHERGLGVAVKSVKFTIPPPSHSLPQPRKAVKVSAPKTLSQVTNPEQYCALVDYLTAVLARIAVQGTPSEYWRIVVLAILAKLSTKLKVLAIDLPGFAKSCLKRGKELPDDQEADSKTGGLDESQLLRISDHDATVPRYCLENATVARWLEDCVSHALVDLGARWPLYVPLDHLDVCAIVFRSGANGVPALVHQDRHGNIGGSRNALPLVFSGSAIRLAAQLGKHIAEVNVAEPSSEGGEQKPEKATLEVSWEKENGASDAEVEQKATPLVTVADVVTVLGALAFAKPSLGENFKLALQVISALSAFGETIPSPTKFTAFVCLRLEGSMKPPRSERLRMQNESKPLPDSASGFDDAKPLSQSLLARKRLNLFDHGSKIARDAGFIKREIIESAAAKLEEMELLKKEWVIDGGAVIVKCPIYVWTTLSICVILVVGGLMMGFFVGDRIDGVDPFNLAMFTWLIGGFIILVAKSIRVSDWPWRDFLFGRVTCRSVTELRSVTGKDAQDIIMFLLSTSAEKRLLTRGPFNKPFKNTDVGGFSIDVRPKLQTLLSCGIIPLKVTRLQGPSLVCLDLAPERYRLANANHLMRSGGSRLQVLCCLDLPNSKDNGHAALDIQDDLMWTEILGLYEYIGREFT